MAVNSSLPDRIDYYAQKYHVSPITMSDIIHCESNGDPAIQSGMINKEGKQENSWGLVQINLDYNPSITKEEALDPEFSLDFLAHKISIGKAKLWACYK